MVLFIGLKGQVISVPVTLSRKCDVVYRTEMADNQCDCYTE